MEADTTQSEPITYWVFGVLLDSDCFKNNRIQLRKKITSQTGA
ncbi:MAG: hypothetical protein ACTFAK_07385 [Candidatus Electronema sp. VV]